MTTGTDTMGPSADQDRYNISPLSSATSLDHTDQHPVDLPQPQPANATMSLSLTPASLVVLTDSQVQDLCENLSPGELDIFVDGLATALHDYSTNSQATESGAYDQPLRITTHQPLTKATTLYMPSSSPGGVGLKVLTNSPFGSGTGSLTLMTSTGEPLGFLHARAFTGFRTALASMCLVTRRTRVHRIVVFGSGIQAYWHVRLALKLRGSTIREVHIINRRYSNNARDLIKTFIRVDPETRRVEGWENTRFSLLTPQYNDYGRLLAEHVEAADVIFCCTPSQEELFPAEALTSKEARKRGRLVVAVGSYKPEMRELPDGLLQQAVRAQNGHRHFHRHVDHGGVIAVDTLDGVLKEAGEIVQNGNIKPHHLVELGELVMLHRMAAEEDGGSMLSRTSSSEVGDASASPDAPSFSNVPWTRPRVSSDADINATRQHQRRQSSGGPFGSDANQPPPSPGSRVSSLASGLKKRLSMHNSRMSPSESDAVGGGGESRPVASPSSSGTLVPRNRSIGASQRDATQRPASQKDIRMNQWLEEGTVVYKSVGFGLMDLVVGMQVIKAAADKGVGCQITGFSDPYSPI